MKALALLQDPTIPIKEAQRAADWFGTASVASVLGFFLILVCWYFIKKEKTQAAACDTEKASIRADAQAIIDEKTRAIDDLVTHLNAATEDSHKRMDKFVQMMADGAQRTEQVLSDNAVKMATLQQSIQDLRQEVQTLRNNHRGGA